MQFRFDHISEVRAKCLEELKARKIAFEIFWPLIQNQEESELKTKENEEIEEKLDKDKVKLLGEVDKELDFDEKEFEKLWAIEVVGMMGAKKGIKSFKKMSTKDFESLETQKKVKPKKSSKNLDLDLF